MKYYVYEHYYIINENKKVIYVGKGSKNRCYDFVRRNDKWKDYVNENGLPLVNIVKYFNEEKDAYDFERKLRNEYYDKNECMCCKDVNLMGENSYWHKNGVSEEIREKIRKTLTGRKRSEEERLKISKATSGKNNPNYGNGYKIAGEKHVDARKCAIINASGDVEKVFTNVKFLIEYVKEVYGYTNVKYYLRSGEKLNPKYAKYSKLKGYKFIYLN